jgi:hypothetical protein
MSIDEGALRTRDAVDWKFCHPAMEDGKPAGIEYVHNQTEMAFKYLSAPRAAAERKVRLTTIG